MKFILLFLMSCSSHSAHNFSKAKKILPLIFQNEQVTLYCGCEYTQKTIDLQSCGYRPQRDLKRAKRLEWEHVVPAHAFGQAFQEWRQGDVKCVKKGRKFKGRKCARLNPDFARMEGDLYNLYPEIGELNGLRSNFSMAALGPPGQGSMTFGDCKAHILDRKFEPMNRAKGIVARIYTYMDLTYPGRGIVSDKNKKLFEAWDKMFPATKSECERMILIRNATGMLNPILEKACLKK